MPPRIDLFQATMQGWARPAAARALFQSGPEGGAATRHAGVSRLAPAEAQEPASRRSDRSGALHAWECRHCPLA
jgi:hypothetical protein